MALAEVRSLLSRAWKEQWDVEIWTLEVSHYKNKLNGDLCKKFISHLTGEKVIIAENIFFWMISISNVFISFENDPVNL